MSGSRLDQLNGKIARLLDSELPEMRAPSAAQRSLAQADAIVALSQQLGHVLGRSAMSDLQSFETYLELALTCIRRAAIDRDRLLRGTDGRQS